MKLQDFVRKYPVHAKWAICTLSLGFFASFMALSVLGFAVCHQRTVARNTNAALVIADMLALQENEDEESVQSTVYRALIEARAPACLSSEDARRLLLILRGDRETVGELCDILRSSAGIGQEPAYMLRYAVRQCHPKQATVSGPSGTPGEVQTASRRNLAPYDAKKLAESFFAVPYAFQSSGDLSYCGNLCARFNERNARLISFSAEWPDSLAEELSADACKEAAVSFIEQRAGIRNFTVEEVFTADGICWVMATDYNGVCWKTGVRCDTGGVCFFCAVPAEENG